MKKRVGFRLLQLILSRVSDDRLTMAMLHWDGERLRVASSLWGLAALDPEHRDGIRVAVLDIVKQAEEVARRLEEAPKPDLRLAEVFPVREGLGAALYWTPVTTLHTRDVAAHFDDLVHELRLDREVPPSVERAADSCPPDPGPCSPSELVAARAHAVPATSASCHG